MFMEHSGNWNIAPDTLWYLYRVYPVCVNANPVPQIMYRIEIVLIQKFLNDFNDLKHARWQPSSTPTAKIVKFQLHGYMQS